jgi:hypothetical protein
MTISIPSAVPCEYSEPCPCHGSTLRVLRPAPFSIFSKTFYKPKTRHRLSMAIPTVHDRGLGYSNSLHSAEVVHFTHTIRILIVWASSPHSILCHDKHPIRAFHSSTLVRVPALWSLPPRHVPAVPPLERNSGATAGEPKCLPAK